MPKALSKGRSFVAQLLAQLPFGAAQRPLLRSE